MKDQAKNLALIASDQGEKTFMLQMTILINKVIMLVILFFSVRVIVIDSIQLT